MVESLREADRFKKRKGPLVLCIMDGVGISDKTEGNGVSLARMPHFKSLEETYPSVLLKAHGKAVGLPSDGDMGNSEVGHNAIGSGRVFDQGSKLVGRALKEGTLYQRKTWKSLLEDCRQDRGTLHFIGLLSDGNVHSHIDHLKHMVSKAKEEGVSRLRIHGLLDGRDVGETSALEYFGPFSNFLEEISRDGCDAAFASGGGRMCITMDRYGAHWEMVEKGWKTHVLAEGEAFPSAQEAIKTLRERTQAIDQDLPPFIVKDRHGQRSPIVDGDSVILFNFRGDRAIELSRAFEEGASFDAFDRKRVPKIAFAGMMEYDGDLHIPQNFLIDPPSIDKTMAEYLCASEIRQYSISETQKYGHITYFFNGNRSEKFSKHWETYEEILSDLGGFDKRPAMKCVEITDKVVGAIECGDYRFIKLNYPNGDMVGHTGKLPAVVASLEALDLCVGRLKSAVDKAEGILILTADHGNSEDMFERDKTGKVVYKKGGSPKAKTAHSLNPVPFVLYDPTYRGDYETTLTKGLGISSIAATCLNLLGFKPPDGYDPSIIRTH